MMYFFTRLTDFVFYSQSLGLLFGYLHNPINPFLVNYLWHSIILWACPISLQFSLAFCLFLSSNPDLWILLKGVNGTKVDHAGLRRIEADLGGLGPVKADPGGLTTNKNAYVHYVQIKT